jgi:glyoxylase-like metal-dependent hydrolase (beta-lactamase superfamily II)
MRPQPGRFAEGKSPQAGISRLPIPTPFLVGRVNCYLIEDDPLTLVDTGPNSGTSLDELERALAARGRRIEDLERIVITHQHVDHCGLLAIAGRRSGAEVCAFAPLRAYLAEYSASAAADDAYAQQLMRRHGVPHDLVTALGAVAAAFRAYGSTAQVDVELHEGDRLEFADRTLEVFHRPGHSPSDLVFLDERRSILIGGDHLLAHISSNPLASRPLGDDAAPARKPLLEYIESMRATRELGAKLVLPGHGEPIDDVSALVGERLGLHERRARKILRMVQEGPTSAYGIAERMWGNVAVTQAFLTLSEVLGHLDLLLADGSVTEEESGGRVSFRASAAQPTG